MNYNDNSNNNHITTALLLAAGTGSRLLPLTQNAPKCLTLVHETSILSRLIMSLNEQGFKRLVIVTGHQERSISQYLGVKSGEMEIEYVHNQKYSTTNNIYSLWLAREIIHEPFVLFESDVVFHSSHLDNMIWPDRIAIAGISPWMNGTTVTLNSEQKVTAFHNSVKLYSDVLKYKTVNIYSFSLASWRLIIKHLNKHIGEGKVNGFYETVLSELVEDESLSLQAVSFDSEPWYEIDTIGDLSEAMKLFPPENYEEQKVNNLVM